jgi:hypothetical protein
MTEASFQECRKVMQKANYLRGLITKAKGEVAKWTKIEDVHRHEFRDGQANGAKKCLEKALQKLNGLREKFEELEFPPHNLTVIPQKKAQCLGCGELVPEETDFCDNCKS